MKFWTKKENGRENFDFLLLQLAWIVSDLCYYWRVLQHHAQAFRINITIELEKNE